MKVEMQSGLRTFLIVIIVIFSGWWWLQSLVAYRDVRPSTELIREELYRVWALSDRLPTEQELLRVAWLTGACDMNQHMTFKHYPILLCCIAVIAFLALIPERRKKTTQKDEKLHPSPPPLPRAPTGHSEGEG